jgi:chemotaxis regulatin CheY-phosphate phosphatase CheZ
MAEQGQHQSAPREQTTADAQEGFLAKLVEALTGLLPLLDNIKISIAESSGKIPKASSQLNSVTQATESATVEILNALDGMSQNLDKAESGITRLRGLLLNTGKSIDRETDSVLTEIAETLGKTKESSMGIAMALQVQDITSQQIAGVNHLIEDVRLELMNILGHLGTEGTGEHRAGKPRPVHFDTDAKYSGAGERQEEADMIIQQWTSKKS